MELRVLRMSDAEKLKHMQDRLSLTVISQVTARTVVPLRERRETGIAGGSSSGERAR